MLVWSRFKIACEHRKTKNYCPKVPDCLKSLLGLWSYIKLGEERSAEMAIAATTVKRNTRAHSAPV